MVSSSTTSTYMAWGSMALSRSPPFWSQFLRVTVTANSVPTPFSDSTPMEPFIISTMRLVMAMPRPVEPYLVLWLPSSWEKASKIFGMNA